MFSGCARDCEAKGSFGKIRPRTFEKAPAVHFLKRFFFYASEIEAKMFGWFIVCAVLDRELFKRLWGTLTKHERSRKPASFPFAPVNFHPCERFFLAT